MLFAYISLIVACGIVSGTVPRSDHTPAERARILGPFANTDSRMDFPCPAAGPSPTVPTSVHALKPADIRYIAAIGDSLTAGSGGDAGSIFGLLTEYRGITWSMGGTKDLSTVISLPNILRKYNADLYGQSVGNGNQNSANARFNVGKPSSVSADMPAQANMLVDRMISSLGIDEFNTAWKLVTFFIGANDLCDCCNDKTGYSPEAYRNNVKATLDILQDKMPRTLVNFVTVINVAELQALHEGLICQGVQIFLCKCAINKDTIGYVNETRYEYKKMTDELIGGGAYDTKDDFTVVTQPFMSDMKVPATTDGLPDFSFFTYDCFHFSKKGHGAAAVELWNNMMEPVGSKTTSWTLTETLKCPSSPDGFIYTSKNSK